MKLKDKIKRWWFKTFSEKRKYVRVPISVKVTNLDSGSFTYYQSSNISLGGMFLKAQDPLPPGTKLKLAFSLPNRPEEQITLPAEVVRVQKSENSEAHFPSGMGVRFLDLSAQAKEVIEEFIKMKT